MTHTTPQQQFGRHISLENASLENALVGDLRRVLIGAFENKDLFAARMLATGWQQRCDDGHEAAERIRPVIERAMSALELAEAGEHFSFEG